MEWRAFSLVLARATLRSGAGLAPAPPAVPAARPKLPEPRSGNNFGNSAGRALGQLFRDFRTLSRTTFFPLTFRSTPAVFFVAFSTIAFFPRYSRAHYARFLRVFSLPFLSFLTQRAHSFFFRACVLQRATAEKGYAAEVRFASISRGARNATGQPAATLTLLRRCPGVAPFLPLYLYGSVRLA